MLPACLLRAISTTTAEVETSISPLPSSVWQMEGEVRQKAVRE
ncbi:MAG: hypothetical protein OCU16_05155 [Candidatus Methanospirare jalkutatii]|nr:hypothetical protein [Candidatus Methanospirare jalkutatii]